MLRAARRSLSILVVTILAACSGEPPAPSGSRPFPAPTRTFAGRMRPVAPWVFEFKKRVDPAADAWPSEVAAIEAERVLRAALSAWGDGGGSTELAKLARGGMVTVGLLPGPAARTAFDDGVVSVHIGELGPPSAPESYVGGAELDLRLAAWRAEFAGFGPVRVELDCERVEEEFQLLRMEFRVRVHAGPKRDGARQSDALVLVARWAANPAGGELALRSIAGHGEFQRVRVQSPVLRGITSAVFGGNRCFAEELLRGNEDYHLRQDRLSGQPVLGMHGLAVGDVDGDGLEDVYLPQPGGQANRLFVRAQDGTARDTARAARVDFLDNSGPALFADFDADGDQDLAVGAGAHVLLSWNDGNGIFSKGQVLQASDEPEITTLAAADPDLDGDIDLFACRYVAGGMIGAAPAPYHNAHNGAPNLYWRNEGERKFKECAKELGLEAGGPRFTLAATWLDYDDDGDPDLYVVNDFGENQLLRNDRTGFVDVARALGVTDQAAGMGVDVADVDLDGRLDLYVTNMHSSAGLRVARTPKFLAAHAELRPHYVRHARGNTLLRARPDGTFEDVTERSGTGPAGWGWGARFFDLQNDGLPEIWAPNGFVTNQGATEHSSFFWRCVIARTSLAPPPEADYVNAWSALRHFTTFEGGNYAGNERKAAFLNLGGLAFAEAAGALGADFLGDGRVALPLDWDDDGRVDLLLRDRTAPRLRLLRNEHARPGNWIAFELAGTRSNRDALNARVRFKTNGLPRQQEVLAQAGFMCGASRRLHFGLGGASSADDVEVRWPGGAIERFGTLAAGSRWRLVEGAGKGQRVTPKPVAELARAPSDGPELGPLVGPRPGARPVERIVLLDRLPMGALELPRFDGKPSTISDLGGAPSLVALVDAGDALSLRLIEELERAKATPVALVVQGADADVGKLRGALGPFAERAGPADARFLAALQVFAIEVFGPFESLPLPLLLVFDSAGELVVLRAGTADVPGALADLAQLAAESGNPRGTGAVNPGRWVAGVARDLGAVAQVFDLLGRTDLARFCREKKKARGEK